MKAVSALKKSFGGATFSRIAHARYLGWEDAFDIEFDDGLCFLEPHSTIKKANHISAAAVPAHVGVPQKHRTYFKVVYDTGEIAEVSWAFIRELPPKSTRNK